MGVERVALVELERPAAVGALLGHLAGESLDRRGGKAAEHLGEVRAALHAAEQLLDVLAEAARQIEPDQLAVLGRDGLAAARIRHPVGARRGVEDGERAVDGDADPHLVDRVARAPHAGLHRVVVTLDVGEVRFDVPESVAALVALVARTAGMSQLALDGADRQWHRARILTNSREGLLFPCFWSRRAWAFFLRAMARLL